MRKKVQSRRKKQRKLRRRSQEESSSSCRKTRKWLTCKDWVRGLAVGKRVHLLLQHLCQVQGLAKQRLHLHHQEASVWCQDHPLWRGYHGGLRGLAANLILWETILEHCVGRGKGRLPQVFTLILLLFLEDDNKP